MTTHVAVTAAGTPVRARSRNEGASLWQYLKVALSVALFILMLGLAALAIVVPAVTGSTPRTVLTSSMEPTYPPGTLVIVRPISPDDVRIGDPITYQLESGKADVVTHRVIGIMTNTEGERRFTLQGDNNSVPDDPVRDEQIQGKVWYALPLLGWVNTWINGDGRSWIAPVAAVALFGYATLMVVSGLRDKAKRRRMANDLGTDDPGIPKASGRRRMGVPTEPLTGDRLAYPEGMTPSGTRPRVQKKNRVA
jgi:signal peptidase